MSYLPVSGVEATRPLGIVKRATRIWVSQGRMGRVSNGRLAAWLVCSLLLIATSIGCNKAASAPPAPPPPTVRVVELTTTKVVDYEYFTGRIDAFDTVEVRARVTGYLMSIDFKPGDEVKKGQVLFKIDRRPYEAEMNRVQSQVLLSKARLGLAQADVARAEGIAKTPGAISKQDIDRYGAARAEADAALKSSQAMVETAKLNLEFSDVTAPIEGRVGRNFLTVGNIVVQDQTLLTTIVSEDPLYAYFDVDERTMLRMQKMIREGEFRDASEIEIRFGLADEGNDYPHRAKLDFINNRINSSSGTLQIRATVENPPAANNAPRLLKPGLFIRVRLGVGNARQGLVIPQAAIASEQSRKYLLVVNDKDTIEQRPINVGPIQPDGLQVVEPLLVVKDEQGYRPARQGEQGEPSIKAGEKVVVGGMQRVRANSVVQAKPYVDPAATKHE